ncbi:MAG: hypothetical protein U1D30_00710 [Planctomycetota bacterium]
MDSHPKISSVHDAHAHETASGLLDDCALAANADLSRFLELLDKLLADKDIDYTTQVFSYVADCISYSDLKIPLQHWLAKRISMASDTPEVQGEISIACLDHIPEEPLIIEDLLWLFSLLEDPKTVWAVPLAYTEFEDRHVRIEAHYKLHQHIYKVIHGQDPAITIKELHEILDCICGE